VSDDACAKRLVWRCRRGLLELDLWLGGFLSACRATLRPDELAAFERLLALPDMQILDWLHAPTRSADADLQALLERIRHTRIDLDRDRNDEQNSHPHL
jgi:antitoxin CptB